MKYLKQSMYLHTSSVLSLLLISLYSILVFFNSYSLKIKIQDETPDHDTNKVIPGKLSRNCLRQEKNLVENMRDTIYTYACKEAEAIQELEDISRDM